MDHDHHANHPHNLRVVRSRGDSHSPTRLLSAYAALVQRWQALVHAVIHPIAGLIVLSAAVVEVIEWSHSALHHLLELFEYALH